MYDCRRQGPDELLRNIAVYAYVILMFHPMGLPLERLRLLVALLLVFAPVLALIGCQKSQQQTSTPPDVEVVEVLQRDVPIAKEWVGTLNGLVNAQIRPQVTGYLLRQNYKDGSFVKKGELMFEIDPRTFARRWIRPKGSSPMLSSSSRRPRRIKSRPSSTSIAILRSPKSKPFPNRISTTPSRPISPPRLQSGQPRVKSTRQRPRWMRLNSMWALPKSSRSLTALPASLKHRLEILWGRPVC